MAAQRTTKGLSLHSTSTSTYLFNRTILSVEWLCWVATVWAENLSVASSSEAFVSTLCVFHRLGAEPHLQIRNAPNLCQVTAHSGCYRQTSSLLLSQTPYATAGDFNCSTVGTDELRITGSSELQRSPLITLCSGSECCPHLHRNQWVLDCDAVARVMAVGTYMMVVH